MFSLYTLDHDGHNFWKTVNDFATAVYDAVHMLAKADNNLNYNREVAIMIGEGKKLIRVATIDKKGAKALMTFYGMMAEQ